MITTVHSKSSNFSGFNPILPKFYEMIFEIIFSKTVYGIFLIFCQSSFINDFMVKNNFSEPKNHQKVKYLKTHLFLKNFRTPIFRSYLYKEAEILFFKKDFFQGLGAFFTTAKPLILASFSSIKINFILFFKGDYLILI